MKEDDIARIIYDLINSVSKENIILVLKYWKFEVVDSLPSSHVVLVSFPLKEPNVAFIEDNLKELYSLDIKFVDKRTPLAVDCYIVAYLPTA
jgi:hypothetical protein